MISTRAQRPGLPPAPSTPRAGRGNTRRGRSPLRTGVLAAVLGASLALGAGPALAEAPMASGSGAQYKTTVESRTRGELHDEDFRQASVLASQILLHLTSATEAALDEDWARTRTQIDHALTVAGIIRALLPVREVTTTVRDARGTVVYQYTERFQDDLIPIFEGTIALDVVRPILEQKKEQAAVKGVELADSELIHTAMLLDLSYVERKLRRARQALDDKPARALEQLALATLTGVRLEANPQDDPLMAAQAALELAERNLSEGKVEGARTNLAKARVELETYRTLVGPTRSAEVDELNQRIAALEKKLEEPGAAGKIRGFWHKVTGWRQTVEGEAESEEAEGPARATGARK